MLHRVFLHTIDLNLNGVLSDDIPIKLQQLFQDIEFSRNLTYADNEEVFVGSAAYCALVGLKAMGKLPDQIFLEKTDGTNVGTMFGIRIRSAVFERSDRRDEENVQPNALQYRCWRGE